MRPAAPSIRRRSREAARLLDRALATNPDLLVVNRFGRLESEGGGMLAEIGRAFAEGVAMIVCVPGRYRDAWNAFAAGLDAQLPPTGGDRGLVARGRADASFRRGPCYSLLFAVKGRKAAAGRPSRNLKHGSRAFSAA